MEKYTTNKKVYLLNWRSYLMKRLCIKSCSIALVFFMIFSSIGFFNPVLEVYGSAETTILPKIPTSLSTWAGTVNSTQGETQTMNLATSDNINLNLMSVSLATSDNVTLNLIDNGDFESDPALYGYWSLYADPSKGDAFISWDNLEYNGTEGHSAKITGTSVTGICAVEVPIEPNKEYSFEAWGKGINVTTGEDEIGSYIYYIQYDSAGNEISGTRHWVYNVGTFDWDLAESTFVADANASTVYIVLALDGSGTVWYDDISLTEVVPTPPGMQLPAGALITDTVMHPTEPVMYAVDNANSKLYAINYETEVVAETSFDLKPERVEYSNGKLYATLLKAPHSSYTDEAVQRGAIEIMNALDLSVVKRINIDTDPYDITVSGDYIYIPSGSGQWTNIMSYSETSEALISSDSIRQQSYVEFNSVLNRLYTIDTDTSPRDFEAFDVNNGVFGATSHDSPYHGDYDMNKNFRLSPDGRYIFNGSGLILTCDPDIYTVPHPYPNPEMDMYFAYMLDKPFNDITFDTINDKFYTAATGKTIYSYDYNNYNSANSYSTEGEVSQLYFRDSMLIALSKTDEGLYIVEEINVSDNTAIPVPVVTNKQLNKTGPNFEMDYKVQDSALHPANTVMYIADSINNKIASIDYKTGSVIEVSTSYSPRSIAYSNNEIYVGFGLQGKIDIYDSETMQPKDVIYTGATFFDMTVGNDGYIYTTSEVYTRSYSRVTKQEVSKINVFNKGYLEVHPSQNSLYMTSVEVSPMDLYVMDYNNGSLVQKYDSPYHGDYKLIANNKISPDGKFIFNGSGNIFTVTGVKATNLTYANKLNIGFKDAAFDLGKNRLYTAVSSKMINAYDYTTLESAGTYYTAGEVQKLLRRENELVAISQIDSATSIIEVYNLLVPIECYSKIGQMEAAMNTDLTLPSNMNTLDLAIVAASAAVNTVTDEAVKAELSDRISAVQARLSKVLTALAAIADLETKAATDLTIEENLVAAEAAVAAANIAVMEVEESPSRTALDYRLAFAGSIVADARSEFDTSVPSAIMKAEAFEIAAAKDLRVLSNLVAAEALAIEAATAVHRLEDGSIKSEIQTRINTAYAIVYYARIAYDAGHEDDSSEDDDSTPPKTESQGDVPATPVVDADVTASADIVDDAAAGTQPIGNVTDLNKAVNQAVAAMDSTDENKQTANISTITAQIIANASDIAARVNDTAQKEEFIATAADAVTAIINAAASVKTESNAIKLAESFKLIAQEITVLANITTNEATLRQLEMQQIELADTLNTVAVNVMTNVGTVNVTAVEQGDNATLVLNQQTITDLLIKADEIVTTANNLKTAIAASGIDAAVDYEITLEVAASTLAKTLSTELPLTVLEQIQAKGIKTIEIESDIASITVTPDFITSSVNTEAVVLEVQRIALTNDFVNSMSEQQKILLLNTGDIYDFNTILKDSAGNETKVTNFNSFIEISLPYSLKPGENKESITIFYLAGDGTYENIAGVYDEVTGKVTFKTNHFSKYLIKNNVVKFSDVAGDNWAKKEIEAMASKGIISGNLGKYLPDNNITRAEFVKLITSTLNIVDDNAKTDLKDVNKDVWYYKYVASAVKAGIISGNGTFAPNEVISRQDMAMMLANAMTKLKGAVSISSDSSYISSFIDKDSIADYAVEGVATAVKYKLMGGKPGNKVDPLGKVTRAEAATVIYRLFNK
jgi:hypothetical protein